MRKVIVTLLTLAVVAIGADYGAAIYCESRFSSVLRDTNGLTSEPEVSMNGFPFLTSMNRPQMGKMSVNDPWVDLGEGRAASTSSQLTDVRTTTTWRLDAASPLTASTITSQMRLDAVNLGRFMGINNLTLTTPAPRRAGAGSPSDAWTEATSGILLAGTVRVDDNEYRTTVTVNLRLVDRAVAITATGFYSGPEVHQAEPAGISDATRTRILRAFTRTLPELPLPWGIVPDDVRSSGGQLLLSGTAHNRTVVAKDFRPDLPTTAARAVR